jgi:hypothetical protein
MATSRGSRDTSNLVEDLAATPDRVEAAVRDAGPSALDHAPPGEWSPRTILAHLRDDEFMVMRLRLERMIAEDNPTLAPFDETTWAATRRTGRDALPDLLADLRLQRKASLGILSTLRPDDWRRTGVQPEYGAFDIHWWVEHWLDHDNTHIAQLTSTLAT